MENKINTKNWFISNIKWLIAMTIIIFSNYFILANKVESNTKEIKHNTTSIVSIQIKLDDLLKKGLVSKDLAKEIKFNLKRFMEAQGIQYIEDTDKVSNIR